jgi:rhodanese-related sulfurtransferase
LHLFAWIIILLVLLAAGNGRAAELPAWRSLLSESDPAAQTEWGLRYAHGEGVPRDVDRAVALLCAAGRRGHAAAQYELGWLYANGRGVDRDDALAAAWFRLAAAHGEPHAERLLALMDERGGRKRPLCMSPGHSLALGSGPGTRQAVGDTVRVLAPRYDLDPELVLAVIETESGFNAQARSPKGAQGLMQLMPDTAARFGVDDAFDPMQNLAGGMAYLRWLLDYFGGELRLALAGYNAGERAVDRYRGVPPYAETRDYVRRITSRYARVSDHATGPLEAVLADTSGPRPRGRD